MTAAAKPCRLVLVGMMGSGKTTIGRVLAAATGWPYHDNDALLQRRYGLTAREIAQRAGEDGLRAAEAAALRDGLALPAPAVVGAAAGTITDEQARQSAAEAGWVIWLRGRPETLADRSAGSSHRPWLAGDALGWLSARLRERAPIYRHLADIIVDVDDATPAQIADQIRAEIARRTDCASLGVARSDSPLDSP